ncbi:MAG: glycosyltransferase family 4 protein [Planctomycetota bacterium]|jgi:glycosyltransferase involved in cell wall biosynthesis
MTGRVVFDGSVLAAGPVTGVARSFLTTLAAYGQLDRQPGDLDPVLLVPAGVKMPDMAGVRLESGPVGAFRKQLRLPGLLRELDADVFHSPVAALPLRARCPMVATIHDLPWYASEPLHEPGCGWRHRLAVRVAARRAAAIVVPSRATALDVLRECPDKRQAGVCIIPHGVAPPSEPAPPAHLDGPFLVLGDDRPRKNLARVKQAHAQARTIEPSLPDLEIHGPVHGYVTEAEKAKLLRSCRALLHLSLFEGFGLPVLEAFGHGLPVLCSNRASLPEVAGDAALAVDPTDIEAMANAIVRIHRDEELRTRLRARGLERARVLTPVSSAAGWRHLHRELEQQAQVELHRAEAGG